MDPDRIKSDALPHVIVSYQDAHDRRDVETALAQFTSDAIVTDEGQTYRNRGGVETFLRTAAAEYTFTRTLLAATETAPGQWVVTNHLEGDFPGGVVDLQYRFDLTGDLISNLHIGP